MRKPAEITVDYCKPPLVPNESKGGNRFGQVGVG